MKIYRVILTFEAQTDLEHFDVMLQERLLDKIEWASQKLIILKVAHRREVYI